MEIEEEEWNLHKQTFVPLFSLKNYTLKQERNKEKKKRNKRIFCIMSEVSDTIE